MSELAEVIEFDPELMAMLRHHKRNPKCRTFGAVRGDPPHDGSFYCARCDQWITEEHR